MEMKIKLAAFFFVLISMIILIVLIVFFYKILRLHNKKQFEYLDDIKILKLEKENEILETRVQVQEDTFQLIGREIHDNINQLLTLIKLNLNSIDTLNPTNAKQKIETSIELTSEAIISLTNLSKTLNAQLIKDLGITRILYQEIERINSIKATTISLYCEDEVDEIAPEFQLILFRISQEAIRNSITHGKAKNIKVILKIQGREIFFKIEDDGIGFDTTIINKNSQGLKNIENRIRGIKGAFEILSEPQIGTAIIIKIPF